MLDREVCLRSGSLPVKKEFSAAAIHMLGLAAVSCIPPSTPLKLTASREPYI